ncbi:MAG: hypothetical protein NTW49_02685 [Bacteroidia bacterium]|nr:hypothetical protein [Bacteroidia bacterium]
MKKKSDNAGMVYKFKVYSTEDDDFLREIEIKSGQTFLDFHKAIQLSVKFEQDQMASFFLSDENWEKGREITLFEMSDDEDNDIVVMDVATLSEFINQKVMRLVYVFDFFSERAFLIELIETKNEKNGVSYPVCIKSSGHPPQQIIYGNKEEDDMDDLFVEDIEDDELFDNQSYENFDDFDQYR